MKKIRTHKAFHLVQDSTSSVPEKVFLVEDSLKSFEHGLSSKLEMIGIIGPQSAIKQTIIDLDRHLNPTEGQGREQYDIDLSLDPNEKAAIHLIELSSDQEDSKRYCFAILSAPDSFYHVKPFNPKSILYLLVRYMGDMCSTILLAYDQQIQKDFQISGCPYTQSETTIAQLKMTTRSIRDIQIQYYPFDLRKLLDFNQKYYRNVNFLSPDHNNSLVCVNKVLAESYKDRFKEDMNKAMTICWEQVFVKTQKNIDKILAHMGRANTKENLSLAKRMTEREDELYYSVQKIADKYLREIKGYYKRTGFMDVVVDYFSKAESFYTRVYALIVQKSMLEVKIRSFSVKTFSTLQEDLTMLVALEVDGDHRRKYHYYKDMFQYQIGKIIEECSYLLTAVVKDFYGDVERTLEKELVIGQELIEVSVFSLQIVRDRVGKIIEATTLLTNSIVFKETSCRDRLGIEKLQFIQNIRVYDLKGKRQSKLIWLELAGHSTHSAMLLTSCGEEMRSLRKYTPRGLMFFFSSENQKGYLLHTANSQLTHFKIDELQRITEEKTVSYSKEFRDIVSFSVSIYPEKLFYLTKERNILYSFSLFDKTGELQICHTISAAAKPLKYLRHSKQTPYEFVKCFNEDVYVVLGNQEEIHVIEPDASGKPLLKQTFKLGATFYGISIFADNMNEYMLIHDQTKPELVAFTNMSAKNILEQKEQQRENKSGNPIMDVFVEAYNRFGEYSQGDINKKLSLLHLTSLDEDAVRTYIEQLCLSDHEHEIFKPENTPELLKRSIPTPKQQLLQVVHTRIPIQICTIQEGNLEPLCAGKRQNFIVDKALSIAQRSRMLNFGTIEQFMLKGAKKGKEKGPDQKADERQVLVVSVMGAQSTGKSYLMNRLFGTRFTVASSRTTDGLWISLIESKKIDFLLIDCEGLFSTDRSPKEEEKLIRVIASLSDYTIMNQNMGMSNRSINELMHNIASSAYGSEKDVQNLYKGELFVVVRDVPSNESENIKKQFERNFSMSEKKEQGNAFIMKLFGGRINLFTVNNFENKDKFKKDIKKIRMHFESEGAKRPFRNSQEVLEKLKIVMTQLVCDDTEKFGANLEQFRLEVVRQDVMLIWKKGSSDNKRIVGKIGDKQIGLLQNEIVLEVEGDRIDINELDRFELHLKETIALDKLPTTEFNALYRSFNDFIVKFFDDRKETMEAVIRQRVEKELKNVEEERKKTFLSKLRNKIYQHLATLKLCLNNCYSCKLLCVSRSGHRSNVEVEKENTRIKICDAEGTLKTMEPTPREIELIRYGLEKKETELTDQMKALNEERQSMEEVESTRKQLESQEQSLLASEAEVVELGNSVKDQSLSNLKEELRTIASNAREFERIALQDRSMPELNQALIVDPVMVTQCHSEQENKRLSGEVNSSLGKMFSHVADIRRDVQRSLDSASREEATAQTGIKALEDSLVRGENELREQQAQAAKKDEEVIETRRQAKDKQAKARTAQQNFDTASKDLQNATATKQRNKADLATLEKANNEKPETKALQQETEQLRKNLQSERFDPSYETLVRRRFSELEEIEKTLVKFKPSDDILQKQRKFEEFEAVLRAKLEESATKKSQLQSPDKDKKAVFDCRAVILAKIEVWNKKLARDANNEKYKEPKLKLEKMLQEYDYEASLVPKNEGSAEQERLRKKLKEVSFGVEQHYGEAFAQILKALASWSGSFKKPASSAENQAAALKEFLASHPKYADQEKQLRNISFNDGKRLSEQLSQKKLELEKTQAAYDQTEDDGEMDRLQTEIDQITKLMNTLTMQIQFAQFLAYKQQKSGKKSGKGKKSLFDTGRDEILAELGLKLEQCDLSVGPATLAARLEEINNKLKAMQDQYDQTEDAARMEQLETSIGNEKSNRDSILSRMDLMRKMEQRIGKVTEGKLHAFVVENGKYSAVKVDNLEISVDLPAQKIYINSKGASLPSEFLEEFWKYAQGDQTSKQAEESIDPLFKSVVHEYPSDYQEVIATLECLLKTLRGANSPIAQKVSERAEQIITTGRLDNMSEDLWRVLIGELSYELKQEKYRLQQQLEQNLRKMDEQKKHRAEEQKLRKEVVALQAKQAEHRKNIGKYQQQKDKLQRESQQLSRKLDQLNRDKERLDATMVLLRTKLEADRREVADLKVGLKAFEERKGRYAQLLAFVEIDEQKINKAVADWGAEQLRNIEIKRTVAEKHDQIRDFTSIISTVKARLEEMVRKLAGRTSEGLARDISAAEAALLELTTIREKASKMEAIKATIVSLTQKKDQLEKKAGQLCSCLTDHQCDQPCEAGCEGKKCHKPAGHAGSHLCEEYNHSCQHKCEAEEKCERLCTQKFDHPATKKHDCHGQHLCAEKCKYCDKTCSKPLYDNHDVHVCDSKDRCMFTCILCEKPCASDHHNHDEEIEIVEVKNRKRQKKEGEDVAPEFLRRKKHLCANEHSCVNECSQQGGCMYVYERKNRVWKRQGCEENYVYIQQIAKREKCMVPIPAGQIGHRDHCTCNKAHNCTVRCPDCKSLCELGYGHAETKHRTQHRNQQSLMYVAEEKETVIRVQASEEGKDFLFMAGDQSTPTTCYEGCKRKGRGHFHLRQCRGGDECGQVRNKDTVRHSNKVYYPNVEKRYDMYLCAEYWDACEFEMPNPHSKEQYSSCNFVCSSPHDGDEKKHLFCRLRAWHSFENTRAAHEFDCDKEHKTMDGNSADNLQVCFLIDATGSMKRWVQECKKTISTIIEKTRQKYPKLPLKFSVVGYRDHPMRLSKMVHELKKIAQSKIEQLQRIAATSPFGQATLTEANYIKLMIVIESEWEKKRHNMEDYKKGLDDVKKFVLKYHYPFIFDIDSKEDMVSVQQKMKLANPLNMLLKLLTGAMGEGIELGDEQPIIVHLLNDLQQNIQDLDEHLTSEEELLARLDFSNGDEAIKFLDSPSMESSGGGDPSEAVLDGMNEVTSLKWSKGNGTLKYVFHLFDAPPHGRMYRDGDDFFPDGCPCGLKEQAVIKKLNDLQIKYIVFPLTQHVNKAMELFKAGGLKMESQKIDEPNEITVNAVSILVKQLEQKDVSVSKG